jgi:hypothetical protein
MFDILRLSGALFFTLFVFIYSDSAQVLEKTDLREETEKRETDASGKETNPVSSKLSDKKTESSEKDLPDKKALKDETNAAERTNYRLLRGEKEWNFEFGYSPFEPTHFTGEKEYNTAGRKLGLPLFRWGRVIGTAKGITWQYLFEASPLAVSLKNEVKNPDYISPIATPNVAPTKREMSYGFSITPVSFRFYFFPKSRIKPFTQLGAGVLFTNKPMPLPTTTRINFSGYWGGGVMYQIERSRAITFSYRYLHISNANTTNPNPGYNANVFSIGYSFFYK